MKNKSSSSKQKLSKLSIGILIALSFLFWFVTQALVERAVMPTCNIRDLLFDLTAPINSFLQQREWVANTLIILLGSINDLFLLFLIYVTFKTRSFRPLLPLMIFIVIRQAVVGFDWLPAAPGIIWRDPGFISLTATYGSYNDLFFSPHIGMIIIVIAEVWAYKKRWPLITAFSLGAIMLLIAIFLRLDFFLSIYAAILTALFAVYYGKKWGRSVDSFLIKFFRKLRI